jgi:hypothetical protein
MTEDQRDMTVAETKWWKELKALMRRMPKNVELHAGISSMAIAPAGSARKAFDEDPHQSCDTINKYDWDSIIGLRLDGRDGTL